MALVVCLLAAALVTGCAVNQKKEVAAYRKIIDADVPPATQPATHDVLTLEAAMALANQNNENLGLRGEAYLQALIEKNRVLANFLPTVSFQPNYTLEQRPTGKGSGAVGPPSTGFGLTSLGTGPVSNTSALNTITQGSGNLVNSGSVAQRLEAPVVGNMNLFHGFADVNSLRVAAANIEQQRQLLLDAQATILLNVAQSYYQVLRSERQVLVLEHNLQLQEARVTDMEGRLRNGLARQLDLAQTLAQADATRVTLVQARNDVLNGRAMLAFLIGIKGVEGPLSDTFSVPPDPGPEHTYEDQATAIRQDLLAARAAVEAARNSVEVSVAEYYPSVSLNVAGFLYRESFSDSTKWDAILSANVPIFSAGLIEADVRTAWSNLRQAALAESLLRRQIQQDVQIAYQNLTTSEREIIELRGEVDAAYDAYRQSRDAEAVGLARNLDVLTAQDSLLTAQLQLASVAFDRTVFYLDLVRTTGCLTPRLPSQRTAAAATLPANRVAEHVAPATTAPATLP